jgi:hypothetical protein
LVATFTHAQAYVSDISLEAVVRAQPVTFPRP